MKTQTIQDLITENNTYKGKKWFNKNEFWSKLTSAYSNLNHVMASKIINAIKSNEDSLKLGDQGYAESFAQLLVDKKVSITALVSVMRENKLSFSGAHFYKFLDTLHTRYVKEPGLFTDEVIDRMEALKILPYDEVNLDAETKKYIQNSATPLELVDMLIQKPTAIDFTAYAKFVKSAVKNSDGNDIDTARKTEIILLGLKNLMNYENLYTDKVPVEEPDSLSSNHHRPQSLRDNNNKINAKTQKDCVDKIKGWLTNEADEAKQTVLATQLFHSLNAASLIGTGYEKYVVDYVKFAQDQDQDKATKYAIYAARETMVSIFQFGASSLRKELLGQINLIDTENITFNKDGKNIPIKKFLEKAVTSGRLQREVKKHVMQKLDGAKLKDAAATISGHENVQKIAAMLWALDQETFTLIGAIMGDTMAEIQTEHNLDPKFWNGTMSRGWNKFTSYPVAAFFAVVDFFAIVFEYIGEYATRGAYKAYEGVRDLVTGVAGAKREDQEIFGRDDVAAAMNELVKSLQNKNIDTILIKSTEKDELRDAILNFFKDGSNTDLKTKLNTVHDSLVGDSELKTAISKIKDVENLWEHRKDLQAILEMPEMKQNISNALPNWANNAKAVGILKSIKL